MYGTVADLIECEPQLYTAVDVTAGNSLFDVVVDSDDTASRMIKHLTQINGGRIKFLPLNRLKVCEDGARGRLGDVPSRGTQGAAASSPPPFLFPETRHSELCA
jgi:chromosome segregation ATPase